MKETMPFVKYLFIAILFIFVFICLYSEKLEMVGYGSLFTVHIFLILSILFDVYKDKERARKVFTLPALKSGSVEVPELNIPLYLLITPICVLQLRIVTLLCLNVWAITSKYNIFRISRDNRYRIEGIKTMLLVTVIMLFALITIYILYNYIPINPAIQFIIGICIIGTYILCAVNTALEITASNEFSNTTDG
jgi:hypothetical protein